MPVFGVDGFAALSITGSDSDAILDLATQPISGPESGYRILAAGSARIGGQFDFMAAAVDGGIPAQVTDPVVSNVSAIQKKGGDHDRQVAITYQVSHPDNSPSWVTLEISSDGGATWNVPAVTLVGSGIGISDGVKPGWNMIEWDALADWGGQYSNKVRFRVTAGAQSAVSGDVTVDTRTGPIITITMHRLEKKVLANAVPGADIDAPLEVRTGELAALSNQPGLAGELNPPQSGSVLAKGGLVADGVTPILFKITAGGPIPAGGVTYELTLDSPGDGRLNNRAISYLRVMEDNAFRFKRLFTLSDSERTAYAVFGPALTEMEDRAGYSLDLKVRDTEGGGSVLATFRFGVRKPPVILVHGYNTDSSSWSNKFRNEIGKDRGDDFVVAIDYGTVNGTSDGNTIGNLDDLARQIDWLLQARMKEGVFGNWAFTRYDVVGHSQGGVLLRTLCTDNGNLGIVAFRNGNNHYRGRFRRVITIGSPHAGSTLATMWMQLRAHGKQRALLTSAENFRLFNPLYMLQPKFGVGSALVRINSDYVCDPHARLHLLRTTIFDGMAPGPRGSLRNPLIYHALYLHKDTPTVNGKSPGEVVAPLGSDGVADTHSQGAGANLQPTNRSSTITGRDISHATVGETQTASLAVAQEVVNLLNGHASRFGPVIIPAELTSFMETARVEIGHLVGAILSGQNYYDDDGLVSSASSPASQPAAMQVTGVGESPESMAEPPSPLVPLDAPAAAESLAFTLQAPPGDALDGEVTWIALVYGPDGLTTEGLTLETSGDFGEQLTLTISGEVRGQVTLQVSFPSTSGKTVIGKQQVVFSRPPGAMLTGIEVRPGTLDLGAGAGVPLEVWGIYDGVAGALLFTTPDNTVFETSDAAVVNVDEDGFIQLVAEGTATIAATYDGIHTAQCAVTVRGPSPGIASPDTAEGETGVAFAYQIAGTESPLSYGAEPLPDGLSIDTGTGLISGVPTTQGAFAVEITAANANGSGRKIVEFLIGGPAAAPVAIGLDSAEVTEGRPVGTVVGRFSTADPNPLDTFVYELVAGEGSTDNGSFSISDDRLLTAEVFDADVKSAYAIRVRSTDSSGATVERAFIIAIERPPAIVEQPEGADVFAGSEVSFAVTATGEEPLSYQWSKDGEEIPGATGRIFTIPRAGRSDGGIYRVEVSNETGADTSAGAELIVRPLSYGAWLAQMELEATDSLDPLADYNNDGTVNLLDFAFGADPKAPATLRELLPKVSREGNERLFQWYENPEVEHAGIRVLQSTDLELWEEYEYDPADLTETLTGGLLQKKLRLPPGEERSFYKLEVSEP